MEVRSLGADEAWDLFCERIGEVTLKSHPDIPELARIVVERCRGSPLAVNVIGVTMAGKTLVQEWRYAIDALTLSADQFSGMENEILPVLKFSYDNLKDERVKQCFQYCALFPEDDRISKDDLVEYWIDEGIIDGKEDRYRAEEEGNEIIGYLVHACLLIANKFGHIVTMPTLAREMALWVASNLGEEKENFVVKAKAKLDDIPNVKDWRGVSRMSLLDNLIENISCSPDCPKLTTLFLQDNDLEKISSGFFRLMPKLVVLNLSGNFGLSELPEEISRLVSLQYLNLSNTQIKELPRGLKELKKLIHLDLEYTDCLEGIAGISSLSNLQVLKLYSSFDLHIELVEELQLLKHLEVLTVSVGDAYVWEQFMSIPRLASCTRSVVLTDCEAGTGGISIAATSSRLNILTINESNIREIKIDQKVDDDSKSIPNTMSLSNTRNFRHLANVEISECQGLQDLTWLLFAPNLLRLEVRDSPQIKEIISKEKAASFMNGEAYEIMPFPKLTHLSLNNLDELNSIYWSPVSFSCLGYFYVFDCPNLWKLPLGSCSASNCDLVIYGEEEWIQKLQWEEEGTKERFTLKFLKSKVPVAAYPQNQSELELRKRVADLEEENRSIKQRLEWIERLLWQQRQEQQLFRPPQSSIETVVHQQRTGSQSNVPGMQLFQQQPNLLQKDVQQRLQAPGMLPPQNVIHQQRQSQRTLPEMPSTSLDSRENENGDDWQEKVFQKIKSMKEVYLADVTEIYQTVSAKLQTDSLQQQQRSEQLEKLKQLKTMSDRMIQFLNVSKSNIMPALKDKVDYHENQIISFLNMHRPSEAPEQILGLQSK